MKYTELTAKRVFVMVTGSCVALFGSLLVIEFTRFLSLRFGDAEKLAYLDLMGYEENSLYIAALATAMVIPPLISFLYWDAKRHRADPPLTQEEQSMPRNSDGNIVSQDGGEKDKEPSRLPLIVTLLAAGIIVAILVSYAMLSGNLERTRVQTVPASTNTQVTSPVSLPVARSIRHQVEVDQTLASACEEGNIMMMSYLLDEGASANATDNRGFPIIYMAAYHGDGDMVRLLLEAGANVNAVTPERNTPLMAASGNGHSKVVKMLLSEGARPNMKNLRGDTARDLAAQNGQHDIVAILPSQRR